MTNQIAEFFREGRRRPAPAWFIGLCRILFGLLWLYCASWKAPPSFGQATGRGLWYWVQQAIQYPALGWYGRLLDGVVVPNFDLFGWLLFLLELSIGLSLLVGFLARISSALGLLMSVNVLIALAAYSPLSFTTYAMMIMFHLLFITTSAGLNWGVDQILLEKLANSPHRQTVWGQRLIKIL